MKPIDFLKQIFKDSQTKVFIEKKVIPFIIQGIYKDTSFKKKEFEKKSQNEELIKILSNLTIAINDLNNNLQKKDNNVTDKND